MDGISNQSTQSTLMVLNQLGTQMLKASMDSMEQTAASILKPEASAPKAMPDFLGQNLDLFA